MKILKIIGVIVLILIATPFVLGLFAKKEYNVTKSIIIEKPNEEVFNYISQLKNMQNYSAWDEIDPGMKKEFKGTDAQPGFIYSWESENKDVGTGEMEIKKIDPKQRMDFELRFTAPFESSDMGYLATKPVSENQTEVTWGFDGNMSYPMNSMLLFMDIEKQIGDSFSKSLKKLKRILEN